MATSTELATRILFVYESSLPVDGRANLSGRIEAMCKAVEGLKLEETSRADLKELIGATV